MKKGEQEGEPYTWSHLKLQSYCGVQKMEKWAHLWIKRQFKVQGSLTLGGHCCSRPSPVGYTSKVLVNKTNDKFGIDWPFQRLILIYSMIGSEYASKSLAFWEYKVVLVKWKYISSKLYLLFSSVLWELW